jgi:hypothetical protein
MACFVSLAALVLAACTDFTEPPLSDPVSLTKLPPRSDINLADGRFQASVFYDDILGPDGIGVLTNSKLLVVKEFGGAQGVYLAKKGGTYSVSDAFSMLGPPFVSPDDLLLAADHTVYVADGQAQTVFRIPKGGGAPQAFVTTASTRTLFNPFGLAVAPATFDGPNVDPGDLIVPDNAYGTLDRAVWAINPMTGAAKTIAQGAVFLDGPIHAEFASDGTCFIIENAQSGTVRIVTLDADGTVTPFWSGSGSRSDLTIHPITDELFFALQNGEIYRMPKSGGTPSFFAGNIVRNQDIAFNAAGTILYISDREKRQVIQISAVREVWAY